MRRVVITGTGVISAIGKTTEEFWRNIRDGVCGIKKIEAFDVSELSCKTGAPVEDFDPSLYMDKREAKRMDRFTQYAMAAAKEAIEMSGIDFDKLDEDRAGVIIGCGVGGMETFVDQCGVLFEKGAKRISPFFIPMEISNMAAGQIAINWHIKGPNYAITSACASGTHAIGEAFRNIKHGYSDVMVTGGTEAALVPLAFGGFCSMKAMSTSEDPKRASIPFDAERNGFVMGDGAGVLVLEELEHAKARGANIIAEIAGYGATDDAYHMTAPAEGGAGAARAMKLAYKEAGLECGEVDYINAHGTSTPYNDKFETVAIKDVFGDHAYKMKVSSTKSMTGHMLGAAGGVEAIITALALKEGFVPATIGYTTPDPELDLDYVPGKGVEMDIKAAISNSLGFGGHNAAICLKKY